MSREILQIRKESSPKGKKKVHTKGHEQQRTEKQNTSLERDTDMQVSTN
jgi:hypothetical protein